MKKWLIILSVISISSACDESKDGPTELIFMQSYITQYVDGPLELYGWSDHKSIGIPANCLLFCKVKAEELYGTPSYGSTGQEADHFLEIAKRNGDLSYNRDEPANIFGNICCADNFKSMQVKCLNAAWDEAHPIGKSLNDIITIHYTTYQEYVHSGYPENYEWQNGQGVRTLSNLSKDDLTMISPTINLYFAITPVTGEYEMEVTLVTMEGEEKKATCMLEVK